MFAFNEYSYSALQRQHVVSLVHLIGLVFRMTSTVLNFVSAVLTLQGFRVWSKWMDMHLPPNCYRGAASADVETSNRALATMNAHWQMILRVEALAADGHEEPRTILADMPWTKKASIRFIYSLFEKDRWSRDSVAGQSHLAALVDTVPDNKLVEDTHNYLRDLGRTSRRFISSRMTRMSAAMNAGGLESRGIGHRKVKHHTFKQKFNQHRFKQRARKLFESKHLRLPAYMSAVMGERTWASPNPESMRKGLSSFMWAIRWNEDDLPIEAINVYW